MRFRSELLQPQPSNDSEATLKRIIPVYRSPDGHLAHNGDTEAHQQTSEAGDCEDDR